MQFCALIQKGIYDLLNSRSGDWIRLFIVVVKEFHICACEEKNKDMERLREQGFFLSLHTSVTRSEGQEFFLGLHTSVTSTTQWYLTHNRCLTTTHQWNEWLLSEYINEQPGTERMVRNHWWITNACMCQNSSQWPLSGRIEGNLFPLCVYPHDYCLFFFLWVNID